MNTSASPIEVVEARAQRVTVSRDALVVELLDGRMTAAPEGRAVHVVCSPKADYLAVVTAYLPNPAHWSSDSRERKR